MSLVSYELKKQKLDGTRNVALWKARGGVAVVVLALFIAMRKDFGDFSFLFLLVLLALAYPAYKYLAVRISHKFEALSEEAFKNEFLLWIAKELRLTFQPFGAFLLDEIYKNPLRKEANLCTCKHAIVGKTPEFGIKIGDICLSRDFDKNRENRVFELDKILHLKKKDDTAIFDGLFAKFDFNETFDSKILVVPRGEFIFGASDLKLLKDSPHLSASFDVYLNNPAAAAFLQNKKILENMQAITVNLFGKTELYLGENSLVIGVENSEIFKSAPSSQSAKLLESLNKMIEIAKIFAYLKKLGQVE